jgi:dipeptidyl aminopeptidase/acylaminoacyl peptidase
VTVSPDGRWLVWRAAVDSGSITSDGLPLFVTQLVPGGKTSALAGRALAYDDYLTWCGSTLVYVAGPDRVATHDKRLLAATAPAWRPRPLWNDATRAFGSVACAPDGRSVAVLSQRASDNGYLFATRWQLWQVGLDGSRRLLDRPPPGWADESPSWSPDGRALAFVRERKGRGFVWLRRDGRVFGPLASLGYSLGFYGHHDWPIAWRR